MSVNFKRQLPADLPPDDASLEYLRPREVIDPDEDVVMGMVRDATVADTRRLPRGAGKDAPSTFHEPHWGHTTGVLRATLDIDRIEALPERFRVGLFAERRAYPVVARPNVAHDPKGGFAIGRMALKLQYPAAVPNVYTPAGEARELDLLLAEGSPDANGIGRSFFLRDARQLALLTRLNPPSLGALGVLFAPRNWGVLAFVFRNLKQVLAFTRTPPSTTTGWTGKHYFSAGPYALGEGMMKFCLRPRQGLAVDAGDPRTGDPTTAHASALRAWLSAGKDAVFDLCVQLATPAAIPAPGPQDPPRSVMATEYCDLPWDETKSPYVPVGTLTFRARPESDLGHEYPWSPLQFNAWNTLPSMRPLGQLFRARKHVHKAHAETRLEHVYGATPGALVDKAPFEPVAPAAE